MKKTAWDGGLFYMFHFAYIHRFLCFRFLFVPLFCKIGFSKMKIILHFFLEVFWKLSIFAPSFQEEVRRTTFLGFGICKLIGKDL